MNNELEFMFSLNAKMAAWTNLTTSISKNGKESWRK
jgi:hypothetical protein